MRLFGVIGKPLAHSFSKKYFTEKFEKENLTDCRYENFQLESIEEFKQLMLISGLQGLNVTLPYKKKVLLFLDEISAEVEKIGACNCIKIMNGKTKGFNTDVIGFKKSLEKKIDFTKQQTALILGTGGAAKAVQFVLEELQINYQFVSRNPANRQLAYKQLNAETMNLNQLIINTTPLGMCPNEKDFPEIPYEHLGSNHLLFDLIYNPKKTNFLIKGEAKGAEIQNGLEMLQIQADESWKIWNNDEEN